MSFLALMLAIVLETVLPTDFFDRLKTRMQNMTLELEIDLAALGLLRFTHLQWWVPVLIWVLGVLLIHWLLMVVSPALAGAFSVLVLLCGLRFKHFTQVFTNLQLFLNQGDFYRARALYQDWLKTYDQTEAHVHTTPELIVCAVGHGAERALRQCFGLIFWFLALPGPVGPVFYMFVLWSVNRERQRAMQHDLSVEHPSMPDLWKAGKLKASCGPRFVLLFLEWIPARLLALSVALFGQFDEAVLAWRQARSHTAFSNRAPLVAVFLSGVGLSFKPTEPVAGAVVLREGPVNALVAFRRLLFRSLMVWLLLALLLALLGLFQ